MRFDLDMVGAFVPGIAIWLVGGLLVFLGLDAILTRWGFYRLFWNPPLARFALSLLSFLRSRAAREHVVKEKADANRRARVAHYRSAYRSRLS